MSSVSIQVFGNDKGVLAMLDAMETALNPVAIAGMLGATVDPYLRSRAKDRFRSEGDDVTGDWAPLAPSTQEIRDQMGYGAAGPINVREHELENYITQQPGNAAINPWGAQLTLPGAKASGELGDKFRHAQQGGVSDSGKPFPARPVLGMNTKDLLFVLTALATHVERSGRF